MISRGWVYGGVGILGLIAYFVSGRPTPSADLVGPAQSKAPYSTAMASGPLEAGASAPLPLRVDRPALEPAARDPFAAWSVAPQVKPIAVLPPPPAAPLPPTPPPLNLRFAGRMTGPDGSTTVFVLLGESAISVAPGQVLPNGYRVDAVTPTYLELSYQLMNTTTRVEFPGVPTIETR